VAHLVWDWNGTLLDDTALVVAATNATLEQLGGPAVTVEEHRRDFSRPVAEYYARLLGHPVGPDDFARLDETFHAAYRAGLDGAGLATDALAAISAWDGTQSLLSMFFHEDLVALVRRHGLEPLIGRVDGLREIVGGGSKAPHLAAHVAALGLSPAEVVLVGDTVDDADAARAVGAAIVLYDGGITDAARLRATGAPVVSSLVGAVALASRLVAEPDRTARFSDVSGVNHAPNLGKAQGVRR
jgi:phosphoglycolate phosphatase-like HAD superfamily hydrolase